MDRQRAQQYIGDHEGRRNRAYADTEGIMTIGIGMNLEEARNQKRIEAAGLDYDGVCNGTVTLTDSQIDGFFSEDLDIAISDALAAVNNYWSHPEDAQLALTDMSFQLGGPRLRKFVNMIGALNAEPPDYMKAADEIADSLYAMQTPRRAADNILLVRAAGARLRHQGD
jgi:GH24 family phage-related lysozyme (muramidase)